MKRRSLLLGTALVGALPALSSARANQPVTVLYIGGEDCPPCQYWRHRDRPDWLASDLRRRVNYVEIEPPHLREAYQERYWAADLRPILEELPRKNGTPRFLVVRDGRILSNDLGANRWGHALVAIRQAVGEGEGDQSPQRGRA